MRTETATQEMQRFASRRSVLLLEVTACVAAATALWVLGGRLDGALPEVKALFVALLVSFGVAVQNLVPQLIPVLAFHCPRCTMLFHAAIDRSQGRRAIGLRACAHCGLRVPGRARQGEAERSPSN
jgi:hypothetical protein